MSHQIKGIKQQDRGNHCKQKVLQNTRKQLKYNLTISHFLTTNIMFNNLCGVPIRWARESVSLHKCASRDLHGLRNSKE